MEIKEVLENFRLYRADLRNRKAITFPVGTQVKVDCSRYKGYGIVSLSDGCPDDELAVKLPNDNIWFYPMDKCERVWQ